MGGTPTTKSMVATTLLEHVSSFLLIYWPWGGLRRLAYAFTWEIQPGVLSRTEGCLLEIRGGGLEMADNLGGPVRELS